MAASLMDERKRKKLQMSHGGLEVNRLSGASAHRGLNGFRQKGQVLERFSI
jgi:hypothetical protein